MGQNSFKKDLGGMKYCTTQKSFDLQIIGGKKKKRSL